MGALKWAITTIVFAAMSWALYAISRRRADDFDDSKMLLETLFATAAIVAMLSVMFLIKEI